MGKTLVHRLHVTGILRHMLHLKPFMIMCCTLVNQKKFFCSYMLFFFKYRGLWCLLF